MTLQEVIDNKSNFYEPKIKESFENIFGAEVVHLSIQDNIAFVFDGETHYWCKLTARGVKKYSWRIDNA